MTATLSGVPRRSRPEPSPEQRAAEEMVARAREQGLYLTGPDGLLKQLTKTVLETALNQELTEHLGHEKNGSPDPDTGNVRNGTRPKTVLTESSGQVTIDVPRDRAGTFEPQIVKKRQRRLTGVDEIVLSLYARGLTTGEISAHFEQIYGASVSRETVSRITDKVAGEMASWQSRPLDRVYAAVFVDAIVVKIRDGQVANRPVYAAIGVTLDGCKDILGLWAGTGGEGAKFWMAVLTDLKNRGIGDVFFLVCDGLKGLPEVVANVAAGHGPDVISPHWRAPRWSRRSPRRLGRREHAGPEWHEGDWMFTQPNGKPLDPRRDLADWKALLRESGVRDARLHDARHTAATTLLLLGVPERAVMDIMGWSHSAMVRRYAHVTARLRRGIAEQLNEHLWRANETKTETTASEGGSADDD